MTDHHKSSETSMRCEGNTGTGVRSYPKDDAASRLNQLTQTANNFAQAVSSGVITNTKQSDTKQNAEKKAR